MTIARQSPVDFFRRTSTRIVKYPNLIDYFDSFSTLNYFFLLCSQRRVSSKNNLLEFAFFTFSIYRLNTHPAPPFVTITSSRAKASLNQPTEVSTIIVLGAAPTMSYPGYPPASPYGRKWKRKQHLHFFVFTTDPGPRRATTTRRRILSTASSSAASSATSIWWTSASCSLQHLPATTTRIWTTTARPAAGAVRRTPSTALWCSGSFPTTRDVWCSSSPEPLVLPARASAGRLRRTTASRLRTASRSAPSAILWCRTAHTHSVPAPALRRAVPADTTFARVWPCNDHPMEPRPGRG